MKLLFNNAWMTLHAKSMGKFFKIDYLSFNNETHDLLFKKGFVTVSNLPNNSKVELLSKQHSSESSTNIRDLNNSTATYTNLYIQCDGMYFQVSGVFSSYEECFEHTRVREDTGLLCSLKVRDWCKELHFFTSMKPV